MKFRSKFEEFDQNSYITFFSNIISQAEKKTHTVTGFW